MYQVNEEHQMLRDLVKKFVRNELMPLQIGAAMLVGVFYVGIGVDFFQKILLCCHNM